MAGTQTQGYDLVVEFNEEAYRRCGTALSHSRLRLDAAQAGRANPRRAQQGHHRCPANAGYHIRTWCWALTNVHASRWFR